MSLSSSSSHAVQRVCIIGAGAAGLAALHVFQNEFCFPHVTCYEKNSRVGGAWAYAKQDNPMYDSLRTNLPKEIMAFSKHFPFNDNLPSFLHHTDVQNYLTHFAEMTNLNDSIRLSTTVTSASFMFCADEQKFVWRIKSLDNVENSETSTNFDALIIANGHFNIPNVPTIEGQNNFKGTMSHSYDYKNPESLLQQGVRKVLIVGGKSSGTDVAREVAVALQSAMFKEDTSEDSGLAVHISVRDVASPSSSYPNNESDDDHDYVKLLHVHPQIEYIDADGSVVFCNGDTVADIDHILFCTGYSYDFPFLHDASTIAGNNIEVNSKESLMGERVRLCDQVGPDPSSLITVTDRSVRGLYQHMVFNYNPTLSFLGLPHTIVPFPLFYLQARYLGSIYAYSTDTMCEKASSDSFFPRLSPLSERNSWIEKHEQVILEEKSSSGCDDKMYHNLGPKMWDYLFFLRVNSGSDDYISDRYLTTVREIYEAVSKSRPKNIGYPDTYRNDSYILRRDDDRWHHERP